MNDFDEEFEDVRILLSNSISVERVLDKIGILMQEEPSDELSLCS